MPPFSLHERTILCNFAPAKWFSLPRHDEKRRSGGAKMGMQ